MSFSPNGKPKRTLAGYWSGFFISSGSRFRQDDGRSQQLTHCPNSIGQAGSHSRGLVTEAPLQAWQRGTQRGMHPDEVVVETPPLHVHQQGVFGLGQGPGFAHEGSDGLAEGEVDPFDEGGLDEAGEADRFEFVDEGFALAPEHTSDSIGQLTTMPVFDELTIEEVIINLPMIGTSSGRSEPGTEVGGDGGLNGIEVST